MTGYRWRRAAILTEAVSAFQARFPDTALRLYVEALGAVIQPVLDARCAFGGLLADGAAPADHGAVARRADVMVSSPLHSLGASPGPISRDRLGQYVQLVLTDRSALSAGREFGVLSDKTWRLADLGAKHAFLCAGLGWALCRSTSSKQISPRDDWCALRSTIRLRASTS